MAQKRKTCATDSAFVCVDESDEYCMEMYLNNDTASDNCFI